MTNVIHRLKSAFAGVAVAESLSAESERDRSGDGRDSDEHTEAGGAEQLTLF